MKHAAASSPRSATARTAPLIRIRAVGLRCALAALLFVLPQVAWGQAPASPATVPGPRAIGPARSSTDVVDTLTTDALLRLVSEMGVPVMLRANGALSLGLNGQRVDVEIIGKTLQAYHGVSNVRLPLEAVNGWNQNSRFSRSYLDADGDPCIRMDFDLDGGVTVASVRVWLRGVAFVMQKYHDFLITFGEPVMERPSRPAVPPAPLRRGGSASDAAVRMRSAA